ncbi:FidL-like putative membrane protein [Serratia fonticola]|jgi:hypothetical protein|uniref:FidL-like putative membrane protein n=1 Tax=Serratia fonticola TaxID=47917 RepID=A0A542BIH7_SERFO|nr:FidL-like protein [Serratia fonticola]TQI78363.1 FidL-like putative membrane protein [Serratia fonticola]TQI99615.1 FidL-like putative membrane protein [Serratia fonticola]TVZ69138.1 FidL-like putative membrane protein [Serratia fonticola]
MRVKKLKLLTAILSLLFISNLLIYFERYLYVENIDCDSSLSIPIMRDGYNFSGTIHMTFKPNGSGSVAMTGSLARSGGKQSYDILRTVYFDYIYDNYSYLTLSNFVVKKNITDDTAEALFNNVLFDFSSASRQIRVEKLNDNAYLIENAFSPVFICIKK